MSLRPSEMPNSATNSEPLESLLCIKCSKIVEPSVITSSKVPAATDYDGCIRKCETCGIGYSNTRNKSHITHIYRDPLDNIPEEIRDGALKTLSKAANELNRPQKRKKFSFSTSEDALTWTVFGFLRQRALIRQVLSACGLAIAEAAEKEPGVLLWGATLPNPRSDEIELTRRLAEVSKELGETPKRYSELDALNEALGHAQVTPTEVGREWLLRAQKRAVALNPLTVRILELANSESIENDDSRP